MGSKPSNIHQADRPESGGSDRKQERERSGLLDRAKREFAQEEKTKGAMPRRRGSGQHSGPSGGANATRAGRPVKGGRGGRAP